MKITDPSYLFLFGGEEIPQPHNLLEGIDLHPALVLWQETEITSFSLKQVLGVRQNDLGTLYFITFFLFCFIVPNIMVTYKMVLLFFFDICGKIFRN